MPSKQTLYERIERELEDRRLRRTLLDGEIAVLEGELRKKQPRTMLKGDHENGKGA